MAVRFVLIHVFSDVFMENANGEKRLFNFEHCAILNMETIVCGASIPGQCQIRSLSNSNDQKQPWDGLEPGFYYHYKHDSKQGVNDHAYFVFGIGHHTEGDFVKDTFVIYQPLYKSAPTFKAGPHHFDTRPLDKFLEPVKPGVPRFTRITNEQILKDLEAIQKLIRA